MRAFRLPFLLLIAGVALCAQDKATTAEPNQSTKVEGHVFSSDGSAIGGATVTISGPTATAPSQAATTPPGQAAATTPGQAAATPSGQFTYVAVTGSGSSAGQYSFPAIPAGTYDITAGQSEYHSQTRKAEVTGSQQRVDFVLEPACIACGSGKGQAWWSKPGAALVVVILFLGTIWLVRWHNIARPNREMVKAELDKARARFENETGIDLGARPDLKNLKNLLDSADDALRWKWGSLDSWCDFLFWTRGQEITGWARIHEFQRDTIKLFPLGSLDMVRVRLQTIELDLLDIDKTHAKTLAANIKDALAKDNPHEDSLRALLVEALTYLNDEDDNSFAQLLGWQPKAVWLAVVGCVLIVVLAFAIGNGVLFIAGATGGYLSRLSRSLKRADVPSDYGASWTTLFLCPIVGALSGWFGILLIVLLADSKTRVLGAAFDQIQWSCPFAPLTLGLAFAFGISERLFNGIISTLEKQVDKDREAATKPQQPTSEVQVRPADQTGDAKKDAADAKAAADAKTAADAKAAADATAAAADKASGA